MKKQFRRRVVRGRCFVTDEGGSILPLTAIMITALVGGVAVGSEASYWLMQQRDLHAAADAAVYAGGVLYDGTASSEATADARALAMAKANGFSDTGTFESSFPAVDQYEVVLTETKPRLFSALFSDTDMVLKVTSRVEARPGSKACVLALKDDGKSVVDVGGNGNIQLTGCSLKVNSTAADAFRQYGSSTLAADCIEVGGTSYTADSGLTLTCPEVRTEARPMPDPYASIDQEAIKNACDDPNAPKVLDGVDVHCTGTVNSGDTLAPGIHVLNSPLDLNSSSDTLTASGVTFFFRDDPTSTTKDPGLHINGGVTNLTPPTAGPTAGILVFAERSSTASFTVNGNADTYMQGVLYTKNASFKYSGTASIVNTGEENCLMIVAAEVDLTGTADFDTDCTKYNGTVPTIRRVVELIR